MASKRRSLSGARTPVAKRRKRNTGGHIDGQGRRLSIFEHPEDQKQFDIIYDTISSLEDLDFQNIIINHLAQFATGIVHKCDNHEHCEEFVVMLHQDKLQSNRERDFYYCDPKSPSQRATRETSDPMDTDWDPFTDLNESVQLFCTQCTPRLTQCGYTDKICAEERYFCSANYVNNGIICDCGQVTTISVVPLECMHHFETIAVIQVIGMCIQHQSICRDCNVPKCCPTHVHIKYQVDFIYLYFQDSTSSPKIDSLPVVSISFPGPLHGLCGTE